MTASTIMLYSLLYISLYFEVFLLISFFAHKNRRGGNEANEESHHSLSTSLSTPSTKLPSVTITVPCYNEEKTLAGTIQSLLALNYPQDKLAIYIVNDGSTDTTSNIAHSFADTHTQITVLDKKNGGKASAMNLALNNSTSELIGCLDADSFVHTDALQQIVKHFIENKDISAVTPAIMIDNPKNILQMMQRAEYMAGIFVRKVFSMIDSIIVTPGPFSIFRRETILSVGEWKHAHGTEDFEMGLRLQSAHKKIANEPRAQVMTLSPGTLSSLYHQRIRWVYGFLMNVWDYRHMVGNKHYGNVGLFVLPTALITIFGAVYLFFALVFNTINKVADFIIQTYTAGLRFNLSTFEIFYINTSALFFIIIALVCMIFAILYNATQISGVRVYKRDTLLYLTLYGFIAPLWLTVATVRALVSKESRWRVIR